MEKKDKTLRRITSWRCLAATLQGLWADNCASWPERRPYSSEVRLCRLADSRSFSLSRYQDFLITTGLTGANVPGSSWWKSRRSRSWFTYQWKICSSTCYQGLHLPSSVTTGVRQSASYTCRRQEGVRLLPRRPDMASWTAGKQNPQSSNSVINDNQCYQECWSFIYGACWRASITEPTLSVSKDKER